MTIKEFLVDFIKELPSKDTEASTVNIYSYKNDIEVDSYKVINISNEGSNDEIFIEIEKY